MAKFSIGIRTLAITALWAGLGQVSYGAQATGEQILGYSPKQKTIEVTTPSKTEAATCTVELEQGRKLPNGKQATAWVLKDASGRVLRKFHDTTGDGQVNVWAYYRDGEEVYREIDTNKNQVPDQFRWLGSSGSKWGMDVNEDGQIDTWLAISAEEVSQEILSAVVDRDANRLKALMMTNADMDTLGLPKAEVERIKARMEAMDVEFKKTLTALANINPKALWVHLETKMPETLAADQLGSKADMVRYRRAAILYQEGMGMAAKHNWLQTGEMIHVGRAWRIIQAPIPGMEAQPQPDPTVGPVGVPTGGEKFIEELKKLDSEPKATTTQELISFNSRRGLILEQIAALYTKSDDREKRDTWLRQVAECYAAAAQQGDKKSLERLTEWRKALEKGQPGSATASYFAFREMAGEYSQNLIGLQGEPKKAQAEKMQKLQDDWKEKLAKFVSSYPKADDSPDALMQLGMVNEFIGKETESKNWYGALVRDFPNHPYAKKAQGCLARFALDGNAIELKSPTLQGGQVFDIATLKGKPVVVYYWASWNATAAAEFNQIETVLKKLNDKVELVCVNLDNTKAEATKFLQANPIKSVQLWQPGGLDGALANQYGIQALPSMFLVGADGKVANRSAQASSMEDDLKRMLNGKDK